MTRSWPGLSASLFLSDLLTSGVITPLFVLCKDIECAVLVVLYPILHVEKQLSKWPNEGTFWVNWVSDLSSGLGNLGEAPLILCTAASSVK